MTQQAKSTRFYRVPLVCEAASHIGCGCRSKPVLNAIERAHSVRAARLSRSGSVLAVEWDEGLSTEQELRLVEGAFSSTETVRPITDEQERQSLLLSLDKEDWVRTRDLDNLSVEEAGVIAQRVAERLSSAVRVDPDRLTRFQEALAQACADVLCNDAASSQEWRTEYLRRAVLEAAGTHLGDAALGVLRSDAALADHRSGRADGERNPARQKCDC
jgi:hypothetical protein